MDSTSCVDKIITFLEQIGIPVLEKPLPATTFLPGIRIEYGALAVDRHALKYPGDLLHEAGHIAVLAPSQRAMAFADAGDAQGDEIASQAWSYAAAVAIGIPADVVFHDNGYKGSAQALRDHYLSDIGQKVGVPLLAWFGLTGMPTPAGIIDGPEFPAMSQWLRIWEDPTEKKAPPHRAAPS